MKVGAALFAFFAKGGYDAACSSASFPGRGLAFRFFVFLILAVMTLLYSRFCLYTMFRAEHSDNTGERFLLQLLEPPRQKTPLTFLLRQGKRLLIRSTRLRNAPGPAASGPALELSDRSDPVGAVLASLLQGRVRCCLSHEISVPSKPAAQAAMVPALVRQMRKRKSGDTGAVAKD